MLEKSLERKVMMQAFLNHSACILEPAFHSASIPWFNGYSKGRARETKPSMLPPSFSMSSPSPFLSSP
jgi:hypothetical protein